MARCPTLPEDRLPAIARDAIAAELRGEPFEVPDEISSESSVEAGSASSVESGVGGLFVTIEDANGQLRGCIGHIGTVDSLAKDAARHAVDAAFHDRRFAPVRADELPSLRLSVTLLGPLEPISSAGQLDPRRYGVVVDQGRRRGVLLPDIKGVDTIERQVLIACRKGHIDRQAPLYLYRFTARRIREPPPDERRRLAS